MSINWLHVDFKGVMPSLKQLLAWVERWSAIGINGLVLEYEDRYPWRTWPGTFRPGFVREQWKQVIDAARGHGMTVVPLIQTHGHLEWLLKHDAWSSWRENGCWNEVCPQESAVMPAIRCWLDEVFEFHGQVEYLHIGGDETWNLATCPRCQAQAQASPDGKLAVYLRHLGQVIDEVIARGARPVIWADMFWREQRMDLVKRLPPQVMLCDWQYSGTGPWPTVESLGVAGHTVLGGSAIRCGYDMSQCCDSMADRIANVKAWRGHAGSGGLIHTLWARARSLTMLYGPWEGWWPAFVAAGGRASLDPTLAAWSEQFSTAIKGSIKQAATLAGELANVKCDDELADACRQWWILSLRWRELLELATGNGRTFASMESVHRTLGVDPHYINHRRVANQRVLERADQWGRDVLAFFAARELGEGEEFVESRMSMVRSAWPQDWAKQDIAFSVPRSAR